LSFGAPDGVLPRPIRILIGINVAVFLADFLTRGNYLFTWMALDPLLVTHGHYQYWRLLTYMFAHDYSGFIHILFNMLTLWMFGTPVAHEMGEGKFWRFYLFSGLFAGLCSLAFYAFTGNNAVIVGASGAIFALMFAFARFFPNSQILLFFIFPVSAKYAVLIIGAIELLLITSNDHIAHVAHLGGALFAWLYLRRRAAGRPPALANPAALEKSPAGNRKNPGSDGGHRSHPRKNRAAGNSVPDTR